MSGFQGMQRSVGGGKENRKRRSQTESCRGNSSDWQITSNSRCLACGRLVTMCDCDKTRIDPQVKRQKLDTLLLSTPYVRCKQIKALDDFGREESRQRRRIIDKWGDELRGIAHLAATQQRLLLLAFEETTERDVLMVVERRELAERMVAVERLIVLSTVAEHEREERLRLYALAHRERQALMVWSSGVLQLLVLQSREAVFRTACENHEAAARAAIISRNVELLNIMDANEREKRSFCEATSVQREQLLAEWMEETDMIQNAILSSLRQIESIMQERNGFYERCWREKLELEAEEKKGRLNLLRRAAGERSFVMSTLHLRSQQIDALGRQEAATRCCIVDEETSARSALWLDFKQSEKEVYNVEQMNCRQREAEVCRAIHFLCGIADAESATFAFLSAQEHDEREQRYQWMLEKEKQRNEIEQDALEKLRLLWKEESLARSGLTKAMQEAEVVIAAWIQHKTRVLRETVEKAIEQKATIRFQEHDERFLLVSQKAEEEDAVRRWIDMKEAVRQSVVAEEKLERTKKLEMERTARDKLVWQLAAALDNCRVLALERINKQEIFQRRAFQCLHDIMEVEANELSFLQRAAQDDKERAIQEENQRQLFGLFNIETECRAYVMQQEVRHRETIFTQMQLLNGFFRKEAQELLKARVCEVVAAEEGQRRLLMHHLWEAEQRLLLDFRQSLEEATEREKERVCMQLRQREISLVEDARVYSEDEVLTFNFSDGVSEKHDADYVSPVNEICNARRQFVCAELGVDMKDAAPLTPASVAFLANVIEHILGREEALTTKMRHAEAAAEDAGQKVLLQRRLLSDAKKRLEELKEKLRSDAAEHNRRAAARRDMRQKEEAQLERNRRRLQEKTEELCRVRESVSHMREAIHSNYQKR